MNYLITLKTNIFLSILALNFLFSCSSEPLEKRLRNHINFLASDALHGRETGTQYEKMATAYVKNEFKLIGLEPMGENGTFYQDYKYIAGKSLGKNNHLIIDGVELEIEKDFIPLNFSASGAVEGKLLNKGFDVYSEKSGFTVQNSNEELQKGIFLIKISTLDSNKIIRYWKYLELRDLVVTAEKQGALAVIFYSNDSALVDVKTNFKNKIPSVQIPVVFVTNNTLIRSDSTQIIHIKVEHMEHWRTGRNVVGLIDNGSENTIIIAGHHDGLGHGEYSESFSEDDTHLIHNGADDGASGISVLIEFARRVKTHNMNKNNYLFISFSGEEIGLLGSSYYTNYPTIDLKKVTCMISLDHIGRMDSIEENFILYGVGTSPGWSELLNEIKKEGNSIITYATGIGLTDYTSFYLKNIPVLGFCTNVHKDFHTPADDADKINYEGMIRIFDCITQIDSALAYSGKLEFTNTIDPHELLKYLLRHTEYSFEGTMN